MNPLELFNSVDWSVLHFFNVDLGAPWADQFWLVLTRLHKFRVVQFGVLPALIFSIAYRRRSEVWKPIVMVGLTIAVTDGLCYRVIKHSVDRPRPRLNPAIASWLRPVGSAHGASFPSNHAANSFAAAGAMSWYFARGRRYFYLLAVLIGISRLCLGVHYPSDVGAGAILGSLVAFAITRGLIARRPALWFSDRDALLKAR